MNKNKARRNRRKRNENFESEQERTKEEEAHQSDVNKTAACIQNKTKKQGAKGFLTGTVIVSTLRPRRPVTMATDFLVLWRP